MRLQRGERIRRDFRTCRGNAGDQRGLAGIGKSDQPDIRQQLQFQAQAALLAGLAGLVFGGRLMGGSGKSGVALAAAPAARDEEPLAGSRKIVQALAGGLVVNHGADGHLEVDRVAFGPGAIAAFSVAAALRFVLGIKTELDEGVLVLRGYQEDIAAAAAIAAAGAAARNILLAAKGQATVAAIPGFYQDASFIDEHGGTAP